MASSWILRFKNFNTLPQEIQTRIIAFLAKDDFPNAKELYDYWHQRQLYKHKNTDPLNQRYETDS